MLRPHGISELLTQEQMEFCKQVADSKGLSVEEYVRRVLDLELEKESYRARSAPKVKLPSGRPGGDVESESLRTLVPSLRRVYAKLREDYGDEFEGVFGSQEQELNKAIQAKDVKTLERIERDKPWIKKKW